MSRDRDRTPSPRTDAGLLALCGIAAHDRIVADPTHPRRELALIGREAGVTGYDTKCFGFRWFPPSTWRFR